MSRNLYSKFVTRADKMAEYTQSYLAWTPESSSIISIVVAGYSHNAIAKNDYVPMRRVPIGRGQFSACQ